MKTLLIDADYLAYRHCAASEDSVEWEPDRWMVTNDLKAAKENIQRDLEEIQDDLGGGDIHLCFSDPTRRYFRHEVLPTYKGNRPPSNRPVGLKELKDWMTSTWTTTVKPNLEADDVMGILATWPKMKGEKIIVSVDKDMLTVPAPVYNPVLKVRQDVTKLQADIGHMKQTLSGDTTDGYSGCPGIGPVKAQKILAAAHDARTYLWSAVVAVFEDKGLTEEDALVQAQVARICRAEDWDFKRKKVKLWGPKKGGA